VRDGEGGELGDGLMVGLLRPGQIAARTKRIKVGTAVHVLPLTHPLRLAEETATVDQVSRGRFILGAGRSGNPRGYAAYGVPYSESRERFLETLEIVKRAWTQERFSYDGKFWHFDNASAVPHRPVPITMVCVALSLQRSARVAGPAMLSWMPGACALISWTDASNAAVSTPGAIAEAGPEKLLPSKAHVPPAQVYDTGTTVCVQRNPSSA
jgi:alkanesulfonate monooxygenase SsuD/methylene tetrahydromethanopterin reductase-like flavin-dependent oxidoreductase (luciferase family)